MKKIITLTLALAVAFMACSAAPVKKKTATKKTAKTEKIRVEINDNRNKDLDKGFKAYERQDWDEATRLFNAAIAEGDRVDYAWAYLGSIKLWQENHAEAISLLNKAVALMNDETKPSFRAWTHSELSAAYLESGDTGNALTHINKAAQLDPANAHYAVERAVVRFKNHDYAGAGEDAKRALTLNPDEEDQERAEQLAATCDKIASGNNTPVAVNNVTAERDTVTADGAVLPEFPGGRKAMQEFIRDNVNYPAKLYKKGVQGTVVVECTFDTEGNMTDAQVAEGVNKEMDKEALRVCRSMPRFTPGSVQGVPMQSKLLIQIKFKINK